MSTLVTVLHVVVCLFLMLTVLLQQGKGGGMGGAFGGSNAGSVFGGAGASTFLRRLTAVAATVFMLTSMVLAFFASRDAGDSLEKYSNSEAAKRRRAKEAEKRAFEAGSDAGAATMPDGDAGVGAVIDLGGATTGGATTGGAEVPIEIPAAPPAAGSGPGGAPPAATPGSGSAPAPLTLPARPVAPAPVAPAPVAPPAGPATGSASP